LAASYSNIIIIIPEAEIFDQIGELMPTRGQKDDFSVPSNLFWLDGEGALLEVIKC